MANLGIQTTRPPGEPGPHLVLSGTLDDSSCSSLQSAVTHALEANAPAITLDISALRSITAPGLTLLAKLRQLADHAGATISITNPPRQESPDALDTTALPNGATAVRITGNFDHSNVRKIERNLLALAQKDSPRLLVDLSGADMIVSLGIRLLLQVIKDASARGGRVLLFDPTPTVSTALDFSGLTRYVARGSIESAAQSL